MASTRDRLRDETRLIHERLHGHASFQGLLEQNISRHRYIILLSRLLGYHCGLEVAFKPFTFSDSPLALRVHQRSDLLRADLISLGQSPQQIGAITHVLPPDYLHSKAALLGCLYVREGAMIGGRSLARHLDHLCGQSGLGRKFFEGSPQDAQAWRALCGDLNLIDDRATQDQIIGSALSTFAVFEAWMDGMEPMGARSVTQ
jgi:heme oxygenase (biliverdin-IX-beta and delta-forming)